VQLSTAKDQENLDKSIKACTKGSEN